MVSRPHNMLALLMAAGALTNDSSAVQVIVLLCRAFDANDMLSSTHSKA